MDLNVTVSHWLAESLTIAAFVKVIVVKMTNVMIAMQDRG